jgi:hypothetical protein
MHVTLPLPHRTEGVQADLAWPSYKQSVGQYDTLVCRYDDQDLGDPLFAAQSFDVIISSVSKSECLCKKTCVWWLRGTPPSQRPASMAAVASSCVRYEQVAHVRTANTHTHITPSPHQRRCPHATTSCCHFISFSTAMLCRVLVQRWSQDVCVCDGDVRVCPSSRTTRAFS